MNSHILQQPPLLHTIAFLHLLCRAVDHHPFFLLRNLVPVNFFYQLLERTTPRALSILNECDLLKVCCCISIYQWHFSVVPNLDSQISITHIWRDIVIVVGQQLGVIIMHWLITTQQYCCCVMPLIWFATDVACIFCIFLHRLTPHLV